MGFPPTFCEGIAVSLINSSQREDGVQLTAECNDGSSKLLPTELELADINNNDGELVQGTNRDAASTFQNSCSNLSISGNQLRANCTTSSGGTINSSLTLQDISNENGTLIYTNNSPSCSP